MARHRRRPRRLALVPRALSARTGRAGDRYHRPVASVTRKSPSGRAARRDELRGRLLGVVERLLGEGDTFTEISVERMVAEAGIARSTFYVYFEDKGDLLEAWFGEITAELRTAAAEWWRLGPTPAYPDLRAALAAIVSTYRPHTTLMAAMYDTAAYDAGVRDLVTAMMDENVAGLRKHIRTGPARRVRRPVPPRRRDRPVADLDGRAGACTSWCARRTTPSWSACSTPTPASSGTRCTPRSWTDRAPAALCGCGASCRIRSALCWRGARIVALSPLCAGVVRDLASDPECGSGATRRLSATVSGHGVRSSRERQGVSPMHEPTTAGPLQGELDARREALARRHPTWEPRTLDQLLAGCAAEFGDRPLVITDERTLTYADVDCVGDSPGRRARGARRPAR